MRAASDIDPSTYVAIMLLRLKSLGLSPDLSYLAGFASVAASIAIWNAKKGRDEAHAERFGIFVGLWAPTFFAIGNGIEAAVRDRKS
jgi:hypothetical protein